MENEANEGINIDAVRYIIRNTPIGHLKDSIDNLKILVGASVFEEDAIKSEIIKYEEDHFRSVDYEDEKILISKHNKNSENYYFDQTRKIKFSVLPQNENIENIVNLEEAELENLEFRYFYLNFLIKIPLML